MQTNEPLNQETVAQIRNIIRTEIQNGNSRNVALDGVSDLVKGLIFLIVVILTYNQPNLGEASIVFLVLMIISFVLGVLKIGLTI